MREPRDERLRIDARKLVGDKSTGGLLTSKWLVWP